MLYKLLVINQLFLCLSLGNHNEKYVWASKLNVRSGPGINCKVIAQLNHGEKVRILEKTDESYEVTDTLFNHFSRFNLETRSYINGKGILEIKKFKGKWVKIKIDNQEGFVVDCYLSKLNPYPVYKLQGKERLNYLKTATQYEKEEIGCEGCDNNYTRYIDNENEVVYETGIKEKCGYFGITIKGISKSEGELIGFSLFKDSVSDACGYSVEEDKGFVKVFSYCCC